MSELLEAHGDALEVAHDLLGPVRLLRHAGLLLSWGLGDIGAVREVLSDAGVLVGRAEGDVDGGGAIHVGLDGVGGVVAGVSGGALEALFESDLAETGVDVAEADAGGAGGLVLERSALDAAGGGEVRGLEGDARELSFVGKDVEILGDGLESADHGFQVGIDAGASIASGIVGGGVVWRTWDAAAGGADRSDLGGLRTTSRHDNWCCDHSAVNGSCFGWRHLWWSWIRAGHSWKSSDKRARDCSGYTLDSGQTRERRVGKVERGKTGCIQTSLLQRDAG